jgi:hypothetical protein
MVPRRREAPITATERGLKKACTAFTAAIQSRCSNRSRAASVIAVGNSTWMLPRIAWVRMGKPDSRKTASI